MLVQRIVYDLDLRFRKSGFPAAFHDCVYARLQHRHEVRVVYLWLFSVLAKHAAYDCLGSEDYVLRIQ